MRDIADQGRRLQGSADPGAQGRGRLGHIAPPLMPLVQQPAQFLFAKQGPWLTPTWRCTRPPPSAPSSGRRDRRSASWPPNVARRGEAGDQDDVGALAYRLDRQAVRGEEGRGLHGGLDRGGLRRREDVAGGLADDRGQHEGAKSSAGPEILIMALPFNRVEARRHRPAVHGRAKSLPGRTGNS